MIKLACIDLDGTLLTDDKNISEKNISTLRHLHKLGINIILQSGRRLNSILPYVKQLGFDCPIIAYSGSLIQLSNETTPLFHQKMSWEYTVELVKMVRSKVELVGYYIDDIFHIEDENEWSKMYEARTDMGCKLVPDLVSFLEKEKINPTRIFMLSETMQTNGLYCKLKDHFKGRLDFVSSWSTFLEAGAVGVSKGTALKLLAEKYGWNLEEAVAFGDQENDISAFQACGLSYAMENASDEVKTHAKFVAPPNTEDGVSRVLERLIKC